ncbi:MAG TPA: SDR family NAD(P)-dependent oxidoreductase [Caldilineaceae bacterium]|nr:SDR family NAD(P)-dependent oxidoreductase [Caldilineaceae bacterium]
MSVLDLSGKTILITGGAGAIGQVIVATLAAHGARVAVNDILPVEQAEPRLAATGAPADRVAYFPADANDPAAVEAMFDQVSRRWQMPQIVCCHAGTVDAFPVAAYPLDRFDRLMAINLRAAFVTAQAAVRRWLAAETPGLLLFTTSWVQDVPWPEITPYNASKAGMKALMRGFARELAPKGIRANAIAPGIVGVGMAKHQWDTDPSYRARAEKAIPLGYMQPPESVANAFLFLCSDLASYMTGSVLLVDGGCSLYPMD